ncbi:hypothetical protein [Microbacterium sp. gxy059]|uniref:hypothetical protein n=1 Tax=Microbacterium sp. gxy059 TaxID=2957199 RepID=UPI003D98205B
MATGLPWIRIDSDIASNPKIADLIAEHGAKGKAAAFVYVAAIGYAAAHQTDGHIPRGGLLICHGTPNDARLLVDAGLFEQAEKGWQVANYAEHQPTRAVAEAAAAERSERARKAAEARWGK